MTFIATSFLSVPGHIASGENRFTLDEGGWATGSISAMKTTARTTTR